MQKNDLLVVAIMIIARWHFGRNMRKAAVG